MNNVICIYNILYTLCPKNNPLFTCKVIASSYSIIGY